MRCREHTTENLARVRSSTGRAICLIDLFVPLSNPCWHEIHSLDYCSLVPLPSTLQTMAMALLRIATHGCQTTTHITLCRWVRRDCRIQSSRNSAREGFYRRNFLWELYHAGFAISTFNHLRQIDVATIERLRACLKSTNCKVRTAHAKELCEKETEF